MLCPSLGRCAPADPSLPAAKDSQGGNVSLDEGGWYGSVVPGDTASVDLATARRILRGDERAFRELFEHFFPRLYRFAMARLDGDHDAASEVVQQTLCKGMARLDTYRGEAALYTWFCQICRHTLIDHQRRTRRSGQLVQPLEDDAAIRTVLEAIAAPIEAQPEVQAWHADIRRLVQATLDVLPQRYGDVLEWKYVDGLPVADIAARLDIGPKAAESLLSRARGAFREAILAMVDITDPRHAQRADWSL
jgi:RNA polymerase sigma-70 factor, ECF subfamily